MRSLVISAVSALALACQSGSTGVAGVQGPPGPPGEKGAQGDAGPQGTAGPAGAQGLVGPTGPAGGPLLLVSAADGSSLGPAYGFDGSWVVTLERIGGASAPRFFVFRAVDTGRAFADDLYFASADCSGAPWTEYAGLDAFHNDGTFYRRRAGTLQAGAAFASRRTPAGTCVVEASVHDAYDADAVGPYVAPAAPLDVTTG